MSKSFREDLTGKRFGRLTVLEFVANDKRYSHWKCTCDCGNIVIRSQQTLVYKGYIVSCGCRTHKYGVPATGRLYKIWGDMKRRCLNPNHNRYPDYGGRGITVCEEWKNDFKNFYDWAIDYGYDDTLTIDRIDFNGNYEPSNCRWSDMKTQGNNRRNNIFLNYQGKEMLLADVATILDLSYDCLLKRYQRGDRGEKLFRPIRKH